MDPIDLQEEEQQVDLQEKEDIIEPETGSPSRIQEDGKKENISQPGDDLVTEIYKDYELYQAAKSGNLDDFERVLDRVSAAGNASFDDIMCRLSPTGNTFLHVAAKHGNVDTVTFIAAKKPSLVLSKNFNGETALHLAVKAGDASMVKALVKTPLPEKETDGNNILRARNKRGNTALHEALLSGRDPIAEHLIQEDPELSYYQNKDRESALFLAAKAGFVNCVSLILRLSTDQERINELFKQKSPIQAAILGKHRDVLEVMFDMNPSFFKSGDGHGRTPLHYAAWLGYLEEVRYLLNRYAHNVTQRDNSGLFPIHWASLGGHVDVIRLLLQDFPDPGELLDKDGCNILHLAAGNGRSQIVNFILKNPDLADLINMKDRYGNTPLHLAAMRSQPKIVSALTWDKRVNINLANDRGTTALDAVVHSPPYSTQFAKLLTRAALKAAGTPRYLSDKTIGKDKIFDMDEDVVGSLLLVSLLVATVTFAAGSTVPGGYNSSESNIDLGMATVLRGKGLHMFVFCDTIAMYSSMVAAAALLWAHLSDRTLILNALSLSLPLLGIALSMMAIAFAAVVFMTVSKLGTTVLVLAITFLVTLFLPLLPVCTPLTRRNRILRYVSYYPFCLMILASSKCLAV